MALKFSRAPRHADDREDWLLHCGPWVVGRILEQQRPVGPRAVFCWSLTGPYVPGDVMTNRGEAGTLDNAKAGLVDAMRRWSIWAGVRQADGAGPVAPRWVLTRDHFAGDHGMLKTTCDPTTDWLLMSGGFSAGRVHRPADGPRQDPHPNH